MAATVVGRLRDAEGKAQHAECDFEFQSRLMPSLAPESGSIQKKLQPHFKLPYWPRHEIL